jgi:hypothetical protein
MKALNKMNNLDKGELLCRLFPEELEDIQNAIKKECEYFLAHETLFRESWYQKGFFTAGFWYSLVQAAYKEIENSQDKLWKHPRSFADCFFDGHNSLFALYCLIEYADNEKCNNNLKQAIHLFFGSEKIISITIQNNKS